MLWVCRVILTGCTECVRYGKGDSPWQLAHLALVVTGYRSLDMAWVRARRCLCIWLRLAGAGGGGMAEEDRIGLAEFLTDLRAELSKAQSRAAGDSLKLGVEEISATRNRWRTR